MAIFLFLAMWWTTPAQAVDSFAFQWELVAGSPAIYWPLRQQPVPDSLLRVSREEAQANIQALLSPETVSEFHLVAASGAGDLYAQARLGSQVTHLVRSRDGGASWSSVWFLKAQSHGLRHTDLPVDILSLAFDPRDPEAVLVGTNAGLFLKGHPLFRPPSTLDVATLALHPQNPDILFMATHRLNYGATPSLSGQGLYRARGLEQPNGQVVWEDLSPKLPGQVEEVGFDLKDANRIYIRTFLGSKVYGQTFPDQLRAEDFGWETIAALPSQVKFVHPTEDSPFPLRVSSGYVASLLGYYDIDLSHVFDGYLFSLWGTIFAQNHWTKTGLYSATVFGSRDGGFSWDQVGGYSRDDDNLPNPLFLYDSQGQIRVFPNDLPGIAADKIGPWTTDPLDPFTFYVTQQGRGLLYRTQNLSAWEELSQGLDPMLQISGVAVDSLANIYLRTGKGYLRKQGIPHPFRLAEMHLSSDTLSADDEFHISVRPVAYAGHQGAFDATLSAMLGNQSYPLADPEGDGEYTARLRLGQDHPVGFDGVTLFLEVPGQPLARVSQRLQFMILPAEEIPLYQDEVAPGWQVHLDAGNLDLNSTRTFSGNAALQLEGQATWQYSGQPIHPFGYLLEFYAAAEDVSAIYNLRLDGQSLAQLDAHLEAKGSWTRVAVPLERLVREPRIEDRLPKPALISELHFDSPEAVYLDEIRLRPTSCGLFPCAPEEELPPPATLSWSEVYPDSVSAGEPFRLEAIIQVGKLDATAELPQVTADLSDLDGPRLFPLKYLGGSSFGLSTVLNPATVGLRPVTITVLQRVGQRLVEQSLSRSILVLPETDQQIYADGPGPLWNPPQASSAVLSEAAEQTHEGRPALKVEVREPPNPIFKVSFAPTSPVQTIGYSALHFAVLPGEKNGNRPAFLLLRVNSRNAGSPQGASLDLNRQEWQEIEVPVDQLKLGKDEPINLIEFSGNFQGTLYLDNIRLVAARPSSLAASWNSAIPDSVVAGVPFKLEATIQLSDSGTTAPPPQVSADLSALGGPNRLPLERTGDHTFRLATVLTDTLPGIKTLTLTLSQETQFGPVEKTFSQAVTVLPSTDLIVYGEGLGVLWQQGAINHALLDFGAAAPVYQGSRALKIEADSLLPSAGTPSQPLDFPTAGLAAYYPFDGDADDHSGNGNNGTVSGAQPASDRTGLPNSAYHFNGAGDQIEVENSATLDIHGHHSLSICAWVETENASTRQGIVNKWGPGGGEDDQFNLRLEGDGTVHFQLSDESTEIVSSTMLQANRWYFVVGVYDAEQDQIAIYLDGELEYIKSLHFDITDTQAPLQIGNDGTSWKGRIDEVRLYDRALSDEEIQRLFQGTVVRTGIFSVEFLAQHSVAIAGYRALHLALHPGDATASSATGNLELSLNGVGLTSTTAGTPLDLGRREWQLVEVSLDRLAPRGVAIQSLLFAGSLQGTFYLDDIRLVAARPSMFPPTLVAETRDVALPQQFHLDPNYPNPFNPSTTIRFALPVRAQVELSLYNLAGQRVATLVSGQREAGSYSIQWDGRDDQGHELASGVYLYRLQAGQQVETRTLLLLR